MDENPGTFWPSLSPPQSPPSTTTVDDDNIDMDGIGFDDMAMDVDPGIFHGPGSSPPQSPLGAARPDLPPLSIPS